VALCRDVARISTKPKRPPTALTSDELRRLHQWLGLDEQSIERDLADLPFSCRPARARETLADRRRLRGRKKRATERPEVLKDLFQLDWLGSRSAASWTALD
jgi:hypothetical protein